MATGPAICVFCSTQKGNSASGLAAARSLAQALHSANASLVYGGGSTGLMGAVAAERVRLGGPDSVLGVIPYALVDSERGGRGRDAVRELAAAGHTPPPPQSAAATEPRTGMPAPPARNDAPEHPGEWWARWHDVYTLPTDQSYGRVVGTPSLVQRKNVMMEAVKRGAPGSGFIALPGGFGSLDEVLMVLTTRQLGVHAMSVVLVNVDGFWDGFRAWMDTAGDSGYLGAESRGFIKVVDTPEEAVRYLVNREEFTVAL